MKMKMGFLATLVVLEYRRIRMHKHARRDNAVAAAVCSDGKSKLASPQLLSKPAVLVGGH